MSNGGEVPVATDTQLSEDNAAHKAVVVVAAIVTALFGLTATIGITGNHINRLYRNAPAFPVIVLFFLIAGVTITLLAPLRGNANDRKGWSAVGTVIFLTAVWAFISGGLLVIGKSNRPELDVTLDTAQEVPIIRANIRYEGLKSRERIHIQAGGGVSADESLKLESLYEAEVGADEHGNLEKVVEIPITRSSIRRFFVVTASSRDAGKVSEEIAGSGVNGQDRKPMGGNTDSEKDADRSLCAQLVDRAVLDSGVSSCVESSVPSYVWAPVLSTAWNDEYSELLLTVVDNDLAPTGAVTVRVTSAPDGSPVFAARLVRNKSTGLDQTINIPVSAAVTHLCVEAHRGLEPLKDECSASPQADDSSWVYVSRPPRTGGGFAPASLFAPLPITR